MMLIAILEDNRDRIDAMRRWLDERFRMYETYITDDPVEFNRTVKKRWMDLLFLSLDHDLFERADRSRDDDGMTVADFLVTREPQCPVIVHSSNSQAAQSMEKLLVRKGWTVSRVIPFDDTTWIANEWIPTVRRLLRTYSPKQKLMANAAPAVRP